MSATEADPRPKECHSERSPTWASRGISLLRERAPKDGVDSLPGRIPRLRCAPLGMTSAGAAIRALLVMILLAPGLGARRVEDRPQPRPRFMWIDVYVDAKDQPLAAYQFELAAKGDRLKIVGIEGGEHAAFVEPPHYDPAAMQNDRIIVAAFNTGDDVPQGRSRVARLHVQVTGEGGPDYAVWLRAAAAPDGKRIPATITTMQGEAK